MAEDKTAVAEAEMAVIFNRTGDGNGDGEWPQW